MTGPNASAWRARSSALLALLALPYLPLLRGQVVYHRDVVRFVYPARWFLRDAVARGELPFWNPHQGLGFAVLGDPQYGLFYPLNWLLLLPGPLPQMLSWFSFAHLALGAFGSAILAEMLGASAAGSLVAGLAFGLSGYTTSAWTAGFLLLASAWIPWCAIASLYVVRATSQGAAAGVRAAALAALPVAMALLLGEVFIAIMAVGFGALVALAWKASVPRDDRRGWLRALSMLTLAGGLGAGLAAIAVIPAARFAVTTARATPLTLELAERWSLHPMRSSELLIPGIFGIAWERQPHAAWVQKLVGDMPLALSLYCGASVVALALFAFRRPQNEERSPRLSVLLALLCATALLTSLGSWTPVHRVVRALVPPLSYMRSPEKYLVLVVASLSLLAGLGATRALSPVPWRRLAWLLVPFAAVFAFADALFSVELGPYVRVGVVHAAVAVLGLLGIVVGCRNRPRLAQVLVPTWVALDLGLAVLPIQRFGPSEYIAARPQLAAAIASDAHASDDDPSAPRLFRGDRVASSIARRSAPVPALLQLRENTSVPFGIDILPGYEAALPVSFTSLIASGRADVLRLLGVRYALLSAPVSSTAPPPAALAPLSDPFPGARLYKVNNPLPRVYVAVAATALPDNAQLAAAFTPDVLSGQRALVSEPAAGFSTGAAQRGSCKIERYRSDQLAATCSTKVRGLAVFVEQWAPGWQASVDGVPTPVVRVNLACRGVPLSAGTHRVVLRYVPPGLFAGALVSALSALIMLGCAFGARRWQRQQGDLTAKARPRHHDVKSSF